jgi:hypothetical protein
MGHRGWHGMVLLRARLVVVSLALCTLFQSAHAQAIVPDAAAVRARYLVKFVSFVQWPAGTFATADSALQLCIAGDDPFGAAIDTSARAERVNGRPISVRRIGNAPPDQCNVLFQGHVEPDAVPTPAPPGQAMLTVADRGTSPAAIQFVEAGRKVRFIVNLAAAQASGLVISSKLLGRAMAVER